MMSRYALSNLCEDQTDYTGPGADISPKAEPKIGLKYTLKIKK